MYSSTVRGRKSLHSATKKIEVVKNEKYVSCSDHLNEYLLNTSLHGLKYVGDHSITSFERYFFLISFIVVVLMSAYFISNIWEKWSDAPIIIGLNPTATQLKNIPFPAVTICNMNQAKESVAKYVREDTLEHSLLQSLCAKGNILNSSSNFQGKWSSFRNFLHKVTQPCSEMLAFCRYANEKRECTNIFNSVLTDEGICCSFNGVDSKYMFHNFDMLDDFGYNSNKENNLGINWTPEGGFPENMNRNMFPRPVAGSGSHLGLSVVLDARVYDYHCSSTNGAGFKILLHNPIETPKISEYGFAVAPGQETRVIVTPRISDASNLIRRISTKHRQCIFANEANLSYFKTYSKKNCEMECESRLIEMECGCVLYYMPRNTEDTIICSKRDAECYENIKLAIDKSNNETYSCSCLPGCYEIAYSKDLSFAFLGDGSFTIREDFLSEMDPAYVKENIALVHIFFIESSFRSFTKGELIGFTEFLSNTGGLLGLFMGFSVLSIVEIFYFLSLRMYCLRKKFFKQNDLSKVLVTNSKSIQLDDWFNVKNNNLKKTKTSNKWNIVKTHLNNLRKKVEHIGLLVKVKDVKELKKDTKPKYPYYE